MYGSGTELDSALFTKQIISSHRDWEYLHDSITQGPSITIEDSYVGSSPQEIVFRRFTFVHN